MMYCDELFFNDRADLFKEFNDLQLQEVKLQDDINRLSSTNCDRNAVYKRMETVNFDVLLEDVVMLSSILKLSANISRSINDKVHALDVARFRISESQRRVQDLLDLQLCRDGVENALIRKNYEQAATHVNRFLSMDLQVLKRTADDMEQDCSAITQSLKILRAAASKLQNEISLNFKEAISMRDQNGVERFFKIFPLINMEQYGLDNFSIYLCAKIRNVVVEKLDSIKKSNVNSKKKSMLFVDSITYLFETVAQAVERNLPLIETHYGSSYLHYIIPLLQKECDILSATILEDFSNDQNLNSILCTINDTGRSTSKVDQHIDPKEIDLLLNEMTIIHNQYILYYDFIFKKAKADLSIEINEDKRNQIFSEFEAKMKKSDLCQRMQILISDYLLFEKYYMEQSIKKAIAMDTVDKDAQVSTLVDDVFFIMKKCIRRGYSSGSLDAACAMINNSCTILELDICSTLRQQLRHGYSTGYLDLTQAYNVMIQGRLQQNDTEQSRALFLTYLNNCEVCVDYCGTLCSSLNEEMRCGTRNERDKLESCLSGFSSAVVAFTNVREYGLQQLRASVLKPRILPWVDEFLTYNHQLSMEEFSSYDANEQFVKSLLLHLDTLVSEFKPKLITSNYDSFISIIADEITTQLEKDILKTSFNRLGGLALDKEIRTLASYLCSRTSWSIREKFTRLTQIGITLNLEKPSEIFEYWNPGNTSFTWRLTPKEMKQFLLLRSDFRVDDIKKLKL